MESWTKLGFPPGQLGWVGFIYISACVHTSKCVNALSHHYRSWVLKSVLTASCMAFSYLASCLFSFLLSWCKGLYLILGAKDQSHAVLICLFFLHTEISLAFLNCCTVCPNWLLSPCPWLPPRYLCEFEELKAVGETSPTSHIPMICWRYTAVFKLDF